MLIPNYAAAVSDAGLVAFSLPRDHFQTVIRNGMSSGRVDAKYPHSDATARRIILDLQRIQSHDCRGQPVRIVPVRIKPVGILPCQADAVPPDGIPTASRLDALGNFLPLPLPLKTIRAANP